MKVSNKLISTLWPPKFPTKILSLLMGIIKHSQSTQSGKFAISFQYSKKEVRDGVHCLLGIIIFDTNDQKCLKNPQEEV